MIEKIWSDLIKPSNVSISTKGDNNRGIVIAEPLERGYGLTLGNALRRVLLSTLQGAAITAIKIDNVLHEFSTIQGVKEDVVDLILNIKNIVVKSHVDDITIVSLSAEGPCEVTAGMIQSSANVEIKNTELVLCNLDKGSNLKIEFTINLTCSLLAFPLPVTDCFIFFAEYSKIFILFDAADTIAAPLACPNNNADFTFFP